MRQYTKSWLAWLFVIPLVVSFAAWGINDVFRPSTPDTVATVGGTDVPLQEFQQQYRLKLRELSIRRGEPITPEMARRMQLGHQLLDQLTAQTALDNVARKLGLGVSDAEVTSQIRGMRDFAGPLGGFDKGTFDQRIAEQGYSEQGFIAEAHRVLAEQQLTVPLQASFQAPDGYVRALISAEIEERSVQYFLVTPAMLPAIADPGDQQLAAYLRAHPSQFSTPEYRDVTFAYVSPADVMGQVNATPEQIKQQYDANASTYVIPEKRDLEQLSFTSKADALRARSAIDAGQSFAAVAASLGKKPADITIGTLTQQELADARGAAAFSLPVNGVSTPVQTPFGWFLVHVTKITPGSSTTLEQATPEIRKSLMTRMAAAKIADMMNACQDALGTGAEIQQAAMKSGMKFAHVPAIDRSGLGPDGKPVAAPDDDQFRAEVFKAEVGEYGDPEQAKSGLAFVIKVNGVTPPKLKPLGEVRPAVLSAWMNEHRAAALRDRARALAAQADRGQDFSHLAQSAGASVVSSPALRRDTRDKTFSKNLVGAIFDTAAGRTAFGPDGSGQNYVVAQVSGIRHASVPPGSPLFQRARNQLSEQMADDAALTFASSARAKQGVTQHPEVADKVVGGESS
ncbi:MAG: peptidylprolyl isomerase [Alphaproteobacteria bacterium]|nr:peptidylprolyl isomerase [Alphaproteobacteria bacterium]